MLGLCHRTTGVPHGCCSNSGCTAHWIASSAAWENAVVSYPDLQSHTQTSTLIPRLHSHTQTSTLIPRPPLSCPDLYSHTQTSTLIPRPQVSYPDLHSHTQTSTLIPRPPLSYPDLHSHTQTSTLIPRPPLSYPDLHSHAQTSTLIPRPLHPPCLVSYLVRHSSPLLERPGDPSPKVASPTCIPGGSNDIAVLLRKECYYGR